MTAQPDVTVVIATRDRPEMLGKLLASLRAQRAASYEIVVVDDGSDVPITIGGLDDHAVRVVRTIGVERSQARNIGAHEAKGRLLVFLDDDMTVGPDFITQHAAAHREWPGSMAVGRISLHPSITGTPFGRFRQRLEDSGIPAKRGPVNSRNLCGANMSIDRDHFLQLGGFYADLVSAEDQDLAMRHTDRGGGIVYLPEAEAIHDDHARSAKLYCRRNEWGYENLMGFVSRYPAFQDNIDRVRVNGPVRLFREELQLSIAKVVKFLFALAPFRALLLAAVRVLEAIAPQSHLLEKSYTLMLGVAIRRGFMRGWRQQERRAAAALLADA